MGRKRRNGNRTPSGRLSRIQPPDRGNLRVQALRASFEGTTLRAADDLHSALGQVHAAGLLSGTGIDPRILLEHGREWHRLYRATFGGGIATSRFERSDGQAPSLVTTATDLKYIRWARVVARLGWLERDCLNRVCVDYGDTLDLPPFLERLLAEWRRDRRLVRGGEGVVPPEALATRADRERLAHLRNGLVGLVEGVAASPRITTVENRLDMNTNMV